MNVGRVMLRQMVGDTIVQQTPGTTRTSTDDPLGRGVPGLIDSIVHGHARRSRGEVEFDGGRALVRNDLSEDSFEDRAGAFGETILPRSFNARVPNLSSVTFALQATNSSERNSGPRSETNCPGTPAQGSQNLSKAFVTANVPLSWRIATW